MGGSSSTSDDPDRSAEADMMGDTAADPVAYPRELERDVVSDGGTRYRLRAIRPSDGSRLVDFHHNLSHYSIYLRFFSLHSELSIQEVERFTHVDYVNRLALVAVVDDRLIAVGRFDRQPEENDAEVAFVVSDQYQHHGIGSLLLDELVKAARVRGIRSFRAETLCENRAMLGVFHHAGFPVVSSVEYGTVTLSFQIAHNETYRAALTDREASRGAGPTAAGSSSGASA